MENTMNYGKHYNLLCERAKTRQLSCYTESHHVVPRCLGGDNSMDNLVDLTPEEHYVAHQLLIKMYPEHKGLIWAAHQLTWQQNGKRNNNKLFGWLRRKNALLAKQRIGKKNGSYGKSWYYNPHTLENIKCLSDEVPYGFMKGRAQNKISFLEKKRKQEENIIEKERKQKEKIENLKPLYERYKSGETLQSIANDYDFSFQSLHRYFNLYFPKVYRDTGRGNTKQV